MRRRGIRFKAVTVRAVPRATELAHRRQAEHHERLHREVTGLLAAGYECVFADEACFTWRGWQRREWSHRRTNIELPQLQPLRGQCWACCGAVSRESGKLVFMFRERAFKGPDIVAFFRELAARMDGRTWFLLLDNATVHQTRALREEAERAGVPLVFNVPYSPWFNSIELHWAQAKHVFRRLGTRSLLRGQRRNLLQEATDAVWAPPDAGIARQWEQSLRLIRSIGTPHPLYPQ